jgi:hypothetical protein
MLRFTTPCNPSREIQCKKAAFVDKAGDNPDEEWSVGGGEHWTPVLYFEQCFGQILEQSKITKGH